MDRFIMLHEKGESFSGMEELPEMKDNKATTGDCKKIAIISAR